MSVFASEMPRIQTPHPTAKIEKNVDTFASTIPVVDISKFHNTATRKEFLESLEKALEVGFFAVINPGVDISAIEKGYSAFSDFFKSSRQDKMTMHRPELSGQRGYTPGETALGSNSADSKEFVHIGQSRNVWPSHMKLEEPAMELYAKLRELGQPILQAIALLLGKSDDYLTSMTKDGDDLMRALHYTANPKDGIWAAEHTDIDLLTLLPHASEKGLEVQIKGEWVPVYVPKNALIVNVGDMLETFSNGRWPSCNHRVKSTTPDTERESIVFFIHPTSETVIKPLANEPAKYPEGTRLEYLFLRLFSLRLLSGELEKTVIDGPFINRIKKMVDDNTAAEAVNRWYQGYQKTLSQIAQGK